MKGVESKCEMSSSIEDQQAVQTISSKTKTESVEIETPRALARGEPAKSVPMYNGCLDEQIIPESSNAVEDELDKRIRSHFSLFEARFEHFVLDINTKLSNLDAKLDLLLHQKRQRILRAEEKRISGDDGNKDNDFEWLSTETIEEIKRFASSPRNFSLGLVRKLFTKEEMRNSNVNGKQGRLQLDKERIAYVKDTMIRYYKIPVSEQTITWKHCIISIDEGCRRLRRMAKNQQSKE